MEAGAEEEEQHREDPPTPFHELLRHSARATWRSNSQPPPDWLTDVQSDLMRRSGKTGKQLRRTNERIVSAHQALSERRERERRDLINASYYRRGTVRPDSLEHKRRVALDATAKPVSYGPEQTLANLRYRLIPNFFLTRRVLDETRSLLGKEVFAPRRVIDAGCGIGSASAAALDLFGADNIEWVHCVDPSRSMRDGCVAVLKGLVNTSTTSGDGVDTNHDDNENNKNNNNNSERGRWSQRRNLSSRNTRITVSESLSDGTVSGRKQQQQQNTGSGTGSFDLALCTYTASELPHVASSMSMAAILWEKLAPNGVLVMIEPGTPDGFSSVRAVRNMLLDCCPPDDRHAYEEGADTDEEDNYGWRRDGDEECHIIAPCTHAHTCPMERHQKDHLARKRGWSEAEGDDSVYEMVDEELDHDVNLDSEENEDSFEQPLDVSQSHPDWDDDDENDMDRQYDDDVDYIVGEAEVSTNGALDVDAPKTSAAETDMFERAFCSFVHALPGGDNRSRGEKFSYLVVQKRITGSRPTEPDLDRANNPFHGAQLADLLAASITSGKEAVDQKRKKKKKKHARIVGDTEKHSEMIQRAIELEDKFLDSDADSLALELVRGDAARRSFGRIVRAPLKRKGHIMVDYCAGAPEAEDDLIGHKDDEGQEKKGRIIRHRVSRRVSARVAPGMYGAARKARWGGLWPNIRSSDRIGSGSSPACEDVSDERHALSDAPDGMGTNSSL